ncbi:hypothetical protein PINS_up008708 [Pythium insidiosum]|nr:hypothetical protein PINS_up008708 [Pythium insidiosum]
MVKRTNGAATTGEPMMELDRLRRALLEALHGTIQDAVEMVCEEHEESFALARAAATAAATAAVHQQTASSSRGSGRHTSNSMKTAPESDAPLADYDLYYSCCNRLVSYIEEHMETSPDFRQQMERIILACHSNASERVLKTVVTKSVWFDCNKRNPAVDEVDDERTERTQPPVHVQPSTKAHAGTKRRATVVPTSSKAPVHTKKKQRRSTARRVQYTPASEEEEENGEEEKQAMSEDEEDDEAEDENLPPRRRNNQIYESDEDQNARDDEREEVAYEKKSPAKQPHYEQPDELLKFKDAIGDMCYPDRRTQAQTRFFKDRLRKAIEFVDAQLCLPPPGKTCAWNCKKIRRQMCNNDLPCRNKLCRMWHDVEAHTDRCHNTHCEFRIRVMLRETMYKIDHKKLEIEHSEGEVQRKKQQLSALKRNRNNDRDNDVERRLLENEIDQLEQDIEEAERDIGVFTATKKAYWATLSEIGITKSDDQKDEFQNYNQHYVSKKATPKKKTQTKRKETTSAVETTTRSTTARVERSRRRGTGPHTDIQASAPHGRRERITRRSTQQSFHVMKDGVIELDDDEDDAEEERKTDSNDEDQHDSRNDHSVDTHDDPETHESGAQDHSDSDVEKPAPKSHRSPPRAAAKAIAREKESASDEETKDDGQSDAAESDNDNAEPSEEAEPDSSEQSESMDADPKTNAPPALAAFNDIVDNAGAESVAEK